MRRRTLLTVLGSTVTAGSGCLGGGDSADDDGSADPTADDEDWRDAPDVIELSAASTGELDLDAEVRNHGTYSRPPVLTVTITSAFDDSWTFGPFPGADAPFNTTRLTREGGAPHARLIGGAVVEEDGCWAPETTEFDDRGVTLEPGESTEDTLAIVPDWSSGDDPDPDQPGCYRLGTYRGETTVEVFDPGTDVTADGSSDERETTVDLELRFELV